MPSLWIVFWERALHICMHICTCILLWRALFQNIISEFGIGIDWKLHLGIGAYCILEKSSSFINLSLLCCFEGRRRGSLVFSISWLLIGGFIMPCRQHGSYSQRELFVFYSDSTFTEYLNTQSICANKQLWNKNSRYDNNHPERNNTCCQELKRQWASTAIPKKPTVTK